MPRSLTRLCAPDRLRALSCLTVLALGMLASPPAARAEEERLTTQTVRPVVTEVITSDPTRQRYFPGQIKAAHETALAFQTIGRIAALNVAPGDTVEKGEVLARLDRVSLQQDLEAAQATVSSAKAQAEYAETSYSRAMTLQQRDISPEAAVEAARASRDSARASLLAAQASLASAQEALSYATLTAPNAGIVLQTPVEQGTVVSAGTTVVSLADLEGREAVIDVPAEFMTFLPADALFTLTAMENTDQTVRARLSLVEPVADETMRGRTLRLTLEDAPRQFRIGSLVTATFAAVGDPIMTLPLSAIAGSEDSQFVWRVTESGGKRHVEKVPVTLGLQVASRVAVKDGISVGDEIVVRGAHSLEDGQEVGARVE